MNNIGERFVKITFRFCSKDSFSLYRYTRLHNYSTRRDSVDLHVVNVPKLLSTTHELQERIRRINEQQLSQSEQILYSSPNGDIQVKKETYEKAILRKRIRELEQELIQLKSQLITDSTSRDF